MRKRYFKKKAQEKIHRIMKAIQTMKSITYYFSQRPKMTGILAFLLFCILLFLAIFLHLTRLPLIMWDEGLYFFRAMSILEDGHYLTNFDTTGAMHPHRNSKLPFTTFFQVISLKLLGINELAIRLPISLIFTATAFYIIRHIKHHFSSSYTGYIFGLICISSIGLVVPHMLRTGEHDVPFGCYILISVISLAIYLFEKKAIYLIPFTIFSIAAFLTKNLVAGVIGPGILLFIIFTKRTHHCFTDWRMYLSIALIILSYLGTIFYLNAHIDGFIEHMWNYELGGRYNNEIENHGGDFFHYLKLLALETWPYYFFLFIIGIGISLFAIKDERLKFYSRFTLAAFISFLIIMSISKTKLFWYIAPLYFLGAYFITLCFVYLQRYISEYSWNAKAAIVLSQVIIFAILFSEVVNTNLNSKHHNTYENYKEFIDKVEDRYPDRKSIAILDFSYGLPALFEVKKRNALKKDWNLSFSAERQLPDSKHIMSCSPKTLAFISENSNSKELIAWRSCKLVELK